MEESFNLRKVVPICGVFIQGMKDDDYLAFDIKDETRCFKFIILTKIQFENLKNNKKNWDFFNEFEQEDHNLVVIYNSLCDNSKEINYIKCIVTSLYLANRLVDEKIEFGTSEVFSNIVENNYKNKSGQRTGLKASIKIGCKSLDGDSYNETITRLYGCNLDSEYEGYKRYLSLFNYRNDIMKIKYDIRFKDELKKINKKLNDDSSYSKRLMSAFRLYFDTIQSCDLEKNILNYATIFEILLLENDESNQRKKAAARSACLLCDELGLKEKEYIAEVIYQFYSYRNKIVHEGYSYFDLGNEIFIAKIINCIKHIIYFLIKKIIYKDIKDINQIIGIVKKNVENDYIKNSFDYIKNKNFNDLINKILMCEHQEFIKPNTEEEKKAYKAYLESFHL